MPSFPDTRMDTLQEMAHLDKLFKITGAVKDALDHGISPQRIDQAVQSFLSNYHPFLGQKYSQSPTSPEMAGLPVSAHDLNTAQHTLNIAGAHYSSPSSVGRGLTYHGSALDHTNKSLDIAEHHQKQKQQVNRSATSADSAAGLADDDHDITLNGEDGFAPAQEEKDRRMRRVSEKVSKYVKDFRPRFVPQPDGDEWVTLSDGAAAATDPVASLTPAPATAPEKKEEEKQGVNGYDSTIVISNLTPAKSSYSKKKEVVNKPAVKEKKSIAAPAADPVTPAKRRGGRPFGYRKQANGTWAFPDGTTLKNRTPSSSGGGKKRKAPHPATAATGNKNCKRQRKEPAAANNGAVDKEKLEAELKGGNSLA